MAELVCERFAFLILLSLYCAASANLRDHSPTSNKSITSQGFTRYHNSDCRVQYVKYCQNIKGTSCRNNRCICPPRSIISFDHSKCLSFSQEFGARCESHRQCTQAFGDGAFCRDRKCDCQRKFVFKRENNRCVFIKDRSEVTSGEEKETECIDGACKNRDSESILKTNATTIALACLILVTMVVTTVQLSFLCRSCSLYLHKTSARPQKNLGFSKLTGKNVTFKEVPNQTDDP